MDGDFDILNEYKEPQERAYGDGQPGASWFARMCYGVWHCDCAVIVVVTDHTLQRHTIS